MTRDDIRQLVMDTLTQHADELLILLLTQRLGASQTAVKHSCRGGGNCASKQTDASKGRGLLLEEDVIALHRQGQTRLRIETGTIVTPLAKDKASELGIELV